MMNVWLRSTNSYTVKWLPCQSKEKNLIVTPIQPQLMRNYAFDSPINPTLFAFNVGNGAERYGVNYGPLQHNKVINLFWELYTTTLLIQT